MNSLNPSNTGSVPVTVLIRWMRSVGLDAAGGQTATTPSGQINKSCESWKGAKLILPSTTDATLLLGLNFIIHTLGSAKKYNRPVKIMQHWRAFVWKMVRLGAMKLF